jgi:uncharacterized protein (TIGR02118 family)
MHKLIRLVKRKPGMTPAQFKDHWLGPHAKLQQAALATNPSRKVAANIATGESFGGAAPPFDGMIEAWFDTLDDAHKAMAATPAMMAVRGDMPNFVDLAGSPAHVLCEEHVMSQKPGAAGAVKPSGQIKIIRTVYRRKDLTLQQFKDYWLQNHSKLEERVIRESPVTRIVATFAVPEPGKQADFDGMVELYFDKVDDIRAMFSGPIPAMMRKDEENFVQMDAPAIRVVAEEYLLAARATAKVA